MKVALIALIGIFAVSMAQADPLPATTNWNSGYGPPSQQKRIVDLTIADSNYKAGIGTLGMPGDTYINNYSQTAIGSQIQVNNGSGTVDLEADQETDIGSQGNGANSTTSAGDGNYVTGDFLELD